MNKPLCENCSAEADDYYSNARHLNTGTPTTLTEAINMHESTDMNFKEESFEDYPYKCPNCKTTSFTVRGDPQHVTITTTDDLGENRYISNSQGMPEQGTTIRCTGCQSVQDIEIH